jgi:hypothetical protein
MSIVSSDLQFFSVASVPTDDVSTSGGAIDTTSRAALTQLTANAAIAVVSDGADTRTVTVRGRLTTGAIDTEVLTLNGTTEVLGAKTWERVLSLTASATSGTRTITCKQGSGGSTVATIVPNETKRHIQFQGASSGASPSTRYEKQFAKNGNGTLSLLGAQITLTADPASKIKIGCEAAVGGTTSVANRLTAPASVTFVDDNVAIGVPGTDLAAGAACPVWVQQSLAANDGAQKSTFTLQLAGTTV